MENVVPTLGNVIAIMLNISPYKSVMQSLNANEMQTNPIPLIIMFLNGVSWWLYGLLTKNAFVLIPNGVGIIIGCLYLAVCFKLAPQKQLIILLMAGMSFLFVMSSIAFCFDSKDTMGIACQVMLLGLYTSPLSLVYRILKTKSNQGLNISLSFMQLINGMLWTAYGFMIMDPYQFVPNGIGIGMATLQIMLYFQYNNGKNEDTLPFTDDGSEPLNEQHKRSNGQK